MATLIYGKGSSGGGIEYPDYSRGIRMNDISTVVSGSRRMFVAPSNGIVCIHMAVYTGVRIDVDDDAHWVGQASDASQVDVQVPVVTGNKVFYTPYDSDGAWFYPAFSTTGSSPATHGTTAWIQSPYVKFTNTVLNDNTSPTHVPHVWGTLTGDNVQGHELWIPICKLSEAGGLTVNYNGPDAPFGTILNTVKMEAKVRLAPEYDKSITAINNDGYEPGQEAYGFMTDTSDGGTTISHPFTFVPLVVPTNIGISDILGATSEPMLCARGLIGTSSGVLHIMKLYNGGRTQMNDNSRYLWYEISASMMYKY